MNIFRFLLGVLLLFIIAENNFCQNYSFRFKASYGTYNLEEITGFHRLLRNEVSSIGINPKIVKEFPPYLNFQVQFYFMRDDYNLGLFLGKASTGGRITYSDYSGEVTINTIISKYPIGITVEKFINRHGNLSLFVIAQLSYILSYLDVNEYLKIFSENQINSLEFISHGIGFEPGVGLDYNYKSFLLRGEFGFFVNYSGDFNGKGEQGNLNGISAEWWGFRAGLVVGFNI
jgi:hypothetical protein